MVNLRRLIAIARKWQEIAGVERRRRTISLPRVSYLVRGGGGLPHKGHFVVYSADKRRFVVPLTCLNRTIFRELLRMSEEEFGLPGDGPITLPCDAASMEYIVSVVKREVSIELEKALLLSLASRECSPTAFVPKRLITQYCQLVTIRGF
ncbi:hypothetical protein TIFTF001_004911 [Ficus carica]|uniref:Small auxin up regulated protein n=1 Tax=Ficus carica TaxID=3494 RepID=A0AA88CYN5_FICCA|nr:hypothetical protein TIFTF001_004911 [Ficus carica]